MLSKKKNLLESRRMVLGVRQKVRNRTKQKVKITYIKRIDLRSYIYIYIRYEYESSKIVLHCHYLRIIIKSKSNMTRTGQDA